MKRGVLRANAWFFNDHRRCSGAWVALVHVGVCCRDLPVAVRSHRWAALRGDVWPRSRLPLQSCFVGASSRPGRKCLNATCPSSSWPGLCLIKKKADFSQNSLVDHLSEIYVRSPDFSLNSSSFHSFNNRIIQIFMWWPRFVIIQRNFWQLRALKVSYALRMSKGRKKKWTVVHLKSYWLRTYYNWQLDKWPRRQHF